VSNSGFFSKNQKKISGAIIIALITSILSFLLFKTEILSQIETRSWDWRLASIADPQSANPSIKIIMIDQSSLERIAEEEKIYWPWPRELYVPIVEFLKKAGAKGVAFDVLYSEQSHYSVNDDQSFGASFDPKMPVILAAAIRSGQVNSQNPRLEQFKQKQIQSLSKASPFDFAKINTSVVSDVNLPIPELIDAAYGLGNVSIPNDSDGIFRHILPSAYVRDIPILSLPFALLNATDPGKKISTDNLNSKGEFTVKFSGPARTYETYSYYGILRSFQAITEGRTSVVSLDEFKNSYVFVGMDAPGLLDLRPIPLSRSYPGVEYHATALDNALKGSFIKEVSLITNLIISVIFILIASFGCIFINNATKQFIFVLLAITTLICGAFIAAHLGYWIQLIVPLLCLVLTIISAFGYQYQLEGHVSRFLKNAFQYYVSPELINKIMDNPSALTLGGERKELTVFFCDIEGFTKLSERIDAQLMGQFLNMFLSEMTQIIMKHQGTVDKYIGDAIVAFWNAPIDVPNHAHMGVISSIECQKRLIELKDEFEAKYGIQPKLRIGLNTGFLSVGNFGSKERFNYTVIGDVANVASRLEGANKFFGTQIMISEETYKQLPRDLPCRKIAKIQVVGKNESITVYEPLFDYNPTELSTWNQVQLQLDDNNLQSALDLIKTLPESKLYKIYTDRILELIKNNTKWDNIWSLSEK
jgi:adenylate cyclase